MKMLSVGCLIVIGVSGCASPVYERSEWAEVGYEQSKAECLNNVQANPLSSFPRCMEAKGWKISGYQ